MELKSFSCAGKPLHVPSLLLALQPLLAVANAESTHITLGHEIVYIEQSGWSGVDLTAVQAAVDAAPTDSLQLQAQDAITNMPLWEKSVFVAVLGLINVERARHAAAAVTPEEFITLAKQKAASL